MPQDNVLDEKLNKSFDMLDYDGDGILEWEDYVTFRRRMQEAFSRADKAKQDNLARALYNLWLWLLTNCDRDKKDEQITREEFLSSIREIDREWDTAAQPLVEAQFQLIDQDGNGSVTLSEFQEYCKVLGLEEDIGVSIFQELDDNGDQRIELSEFGGLLRDFYVGNDVTSAGTRLVQSGP